MKRIMKWMLPTVLSLFLLTVTSANKAQAQPGYDVPVETFYDELAPYGQWINDPQYGYVWSPYVEAGFRPYYSNGYWAMTEYGNTWVSNYPWGWAAFHYGRWTYDGYYGWLWIPDNIWAPSWVCWRHGGGYYGWAPLGPGLNIDISFGPRYNCPDDWWIFIPPQYIYNEGGYHNYWHGPRGNITIINNTTIINNAVVNNHHHTTYFTGPNATEVQQVTHHPIRTLKLSNTSQQGGPRVEGNTLQVYHPQIRQAPSSGPKPAPPNAVRAVQPITKPQAVSVNGGRPTFHANGAGQPVNNVQQPGRPPVQQNNNQAPAPPRQQPDRQVQPQNNPTPAPPRQQGVPDRPQPQQNYNQAPPPPRSQPDRPQPQNNYTPAPPRPQQAPDRPQPQQNYNQAPSRQQQPMPNRQPMNAPQPQRPPQQNYNPPPRPQQAPPRMEQPRQQSAPRSENNPAPRAENNREGRFIR